MIRFGLSHLRKKVGNLNFLPPGNSNHDPSPNKGHTFHDPQHCQWSFFAIVSKHPEIIGYESEEVHHFSISIEGNLNNNSQEYIVSPEIKEHNPEKSKS